MNQERFRGRISMNQEWSRGKIGMNPEFRGRISMNQEWFSRDKIVVYFGRTYTLFISSVFNNSRPSNEKNLEREDEEEAQQQGWE